MTKSINTEAIRRSAVLVTFGGGYYNWKRRDRKAEREQAERKGIKVAGAYETKKNLFAGCDATLAQIKGLVTEARAFHYDHTMPWPGAAAVIMNRLVPKYTEGIAKFQNRMEDLLRTLDTEWATMMTSAKQALGPAHDPTMYPDLAEVKAACYIRAKFDPVPQPNDFDELEQVEQSIKDKIKAEAQSTMQESFNEALLTGWERLRAAVTNARDNLRKDPDTGQRFRTEWHGNLTQLLSIMDGLNIGNDPRLTELAEECESLLEYSPDSLKESQYHRDQKLDEAERIVSKLDGIFAGFGGSK